MPIPHYHFDEEGFGKAVVDLRPKIEALLPNGQTKEVTTAMLPSVFEEIWELISQDSSVSLDQLEAIKSLRAEIEAQKERLKQQELE